MRPRRIFWGLFGGFLLSVVGLLGFATQFLALRIDDAELSFLLIAGALAVGFLIALLAALVWAALDLYLLQPLLGLTRGVEIIAVSNSAHELEIPERHLLGDCPAALTSLARQLQQARDDVAKALARGGENAERQKQCLEKVLNQLESAVVYCDRHDRVRLYNRAASGLIGAGDRLGLGRSIHQALNPAPLNQALANLRERTRSRGDLGDGIGGEFVLSNFDNSRMLRADVRLIGIEGEPEPGYLLTLTDVTAQLGAVRERDRLLQEVVEQLRGPMASLRAAIENRQRFPQMSDADRARFDQIVQQESEHLSQQLEAVNDRRKAALRKQWLMADVESSDLLANLCDRVLHTGSIRAMATGRPTWLHCDAHGVMRLLEVLLLRLRDQTGRREFDVTATSRDGRVFVEILWRGESVTQSVLERWLDEPLFGVVGVETARDIVVLHNSEIWCQRAKRENFATLVIPLPAADRQRAGRIDALPARPEFYDFDPRLQAAPANPDCPLAQLDYVAFDTETTGLRPTEGDAIVSIAGVRIVNGRILSGEVFDQLVNPGRAIPAASSRFHRITDQQVADRPAASVVIPRFRDFVGDAVLVAHNAAFDLKFMSLAAGGDAPIGNPTLDILLLSVFLHEHASDHSLDGIARRLGVDIRARHTALGDSMLTAEIFVRLLDLLSARGVTTLGQALEASQAQVAVRKQQARI